MRYPIAVAALALALIEIPPLFLSYHGPHAYLAAHAARLLDGVGLTQPLWGVTFSCLILVAHHQTHVNRVFSWRPLVALGVVSYGVYLVQEPLIQAVEVWTPLRTMHPLLVCAVAISVALALGILFHLAIERPCTDRRVWRRAGPRLVRLLGWSDALWTHGQPLLHRHARTADGIILSVGKATPLG